LVDPFERVKMHGPTDPKSSLNCLQQRDRQ